MLSTNERELFITIMDYYDEMLSGRGCTDFDFAEIIPNKLERQMIIKQYHVWNGDPEEFDDTREYEIVSDWELMFYLRTKMGLWRDSET